ncbi:DUF1456 family protein [Saccharicrinis aurantiacus]|uniref:DUF1456 family protein n=1 Tax=Saccharicrinis aurantiacus TaxID=1849719 RepID=UPI00094F71D6|nr:DUF1456 family protein [Saccharicrinis aurantiacus]
MNNNDILKNLRFTLNLRDEHTVELLKSAGIEVPLEEVKAWFLSDEDEKYKSLYDIKLSAFLNGVIIMKRGKQDDKPVINEKKLNNNIILRKLKIAFNLKDTDMLEILKVADFEISKHELSAFFRKPGQGQYRTCKDQILRRFLFGLQKWLSFNRPAPKK